MSLNNKKLLALRDYFNAGGSTEPADVLEQLGTEDDAVMAEYVAELKVKFPKEFDPDYKEPEQEEEEFSFWLMNDDKTLTELEQFKKKGSKIFFVVKEPKDLVDIIVAGVVVTVDLLKLLKDPVANAKRIHAAELAKG